MSLLTPSEELLCSLRRNTWKEIFSLCLSFSPNVTRKLAALIADNCILYHEESQPENEVCVVDGRGEE